MKVTSHTEPGGQIIEEYELSEEEKARLLEFEIILSKEDYTRLFWIILSVIRWNGIDAVFPLIQKYLQTKGTK